MHLPTTPPLPPSFADETVSPEALELSAYVSPALRVGNRRAAGALVRAYARRRFRSVRLMGIEGFGATRQLRSGPAEVAWDDLPAIVMAIDTCDAIHAVSGEVVRLLQGQMLTLSGTRILTESLDGLRRGDEPMELTIHCRLGDGRDDQRGVAEVVEELRLRGVAGATALIGVDGTMDGERRRGRLSAHSPELPALIITVDTARVLAGGVAPLSSLSQVELLTAKPIELCKWRGRRGRLAEPTDLEPRDWRKLAVYTGGEARRGRRPLRTVLVEALRDAGAAGATVVQGHLGFALGDPIRPDPVWLAHRKAPIVTTIIDTNDRVARWFELIDDLTGDDGFVTCERVTRLEATCDSDAEDSTEA